MNRVLLVVAFHFPPIATSSGLHRALKFVRYLRDDGWRPVVLTVNPRAYAKTHTNQLAEIPPDVPVHRAFGLDATRHFAIRGRHPSFLAWPDPWASWFPAAVWTGRRLIRQYRPDAIWSTFPITTTNLIALDLAKRSGLPWVSDLRDPITMDGYPANPMRFHWARKIEQGTVKVARKIVFTSEYTRQMYAQRYPEHAAKLVLIPNGYDEVNFPVVSQRAATRDDQRLTVVHSGAMQPQGRSPQTFFAALDRLKREGKVGSSNLRVVFRACGFDEQYAELASRAGVTDLVAFEPYLPYDEAIREMVSADGLLIFQGTVYNHAVPAKIYEYLFARRPIFGVLDKAGETSRVLVDIGVESLSNIDDPNEIAARFWEFLASVRGGSYQMPPMTSIEAYSRRRQAQDLSALLDGVCRHP